MQLECSLKILGRIFRVQKEFMNPSFFTSVFHFFENTRMLSIRLQFDTYTEHTLTNCMRMLSIRLRIVHVCPAYAYEKAHQYHIDHTRMLSIRFRIVCVC